MTETKTIKIGNYQTLELIHESERTLVYRARNIESGQPVILKLMVHEYPSFNELVQFRNQYAISKNMAIPGIVKPYSLLRYKNGYALIMEDIGAISLAEYQRQLSVSIEQVLEIALSIAEILHHLHQNHIIHKDIKPANILIHPETKEVKLIDFSISSLLPKERTCLQTPNVLEGTLAYLSPEQTGRMNRGIDYRSDFYSLGVTFYELLTGKLPFESEDPLELVHAHIAKTPPAIPDAQVPTALANIVLKLMAKNAEQRYQSALGLKHDLEKCWFEYRETGKIEPFVLGEEDRSDRFLIPEKLYGREIEVQTLLAAFERVATPLGKGENSEMMLVAGYSGIGKTAVVNEVHKPITRQKGYFIKGKFDQFNRNIPFSAFVQAFRDLMGQLLGESDAQLQEWKTKIQEALGENGQVIIDVIPELERIIGVQPPIPELSGSAAQNRFNLLFQKFIAVFTTIEHPLTLFLDDLQWADSASLKLMKVLMGETQAGYLLLLGAYRDNEVFPAHPLMLTLGELEKRCNPAPESSARERTPREQQTTISTITLAPLSVDHINQLVAETLSCTLELAAPLTDLVYEKTKGNPFFTTQFLKGLYEEELIAFDRNGGYWQCDLVQVRDAALTDDVVEFMAWRLHKLPPETQKVLKLAACIGNQFDLETLAIICENPSEEVAADLWSALQEGLVLPQSQTYKFFQSREQDEEKAEGIVVRHRFLHDRVQQAAYSLIPDREKQTTHYRIGQRLLQNTPLETQEERIFELVGQLNYGTALISEQTEREQLAKLNLIACGKAKSAIAYQAGREYARIGISLLGEEAWDLQYDITLKFYELAAELASLCGEFEDMERAIKTVLERAHSVLEKVNVYRTRIISYISQNKLLESIEIARNILDLLGLSLPETMTDEDFQPIIAEIVTLIGEREIEDLLHLPRMTDRRIIAIVEIMTRIFSATYISGSSLYIALVATSVKLSIQYGNTPASITAYSCYSIIAANYLQDVDTAVKFNQLAIQLTSTLEAKVMKPEAFHTAGLFTSHRKFHIRDILPLIQEGYTTGLEVGNVEYVGYNAHAFCADSFWCSRPLDGLEPEIRAYQQAIMELNQVTTANWCRVYWQATLNLLEGAQRPHILSGEALEESKFIPQITSAQDMLCLYAFYVSKLMLSYLFEEIETAGNYAIEVKRYFKGGVGTVGEAEFYFYDSLTALAALNQKLDKRSKLLKQVEENQTKLQRQWANYAPMNHQHKVDLVEAEKCRVLGQKLEAIDLYDRAIAGAKENQYIQEEALANELFAKFYLDWGREKEAAVYIQEAYYCYAQWGAKAKTDHLEQHYPQLLSPIIQRQEFRLTTNETMTNFTKGTVTHSSTSMGEMLDLASLMKASRSLSQELDFQRAIVNLMQVIQENAGADTVALMLFRQETLILEAKHADGETKPIKNLPIEDSLEVPLAIVNTVKHTQKSLLLDNAGSETDYLGDRYIKENQPRSILCLPLLERGQLIGIVYLENNRTMGAFTSDRVQILNLLCAQAAITLENARLYQQAQQTLQLERQLHELQQTQIQLIQSEKMFSLGQMVAGIAHEINNPISFIHGNITHANEYMEEVLELLNLYQIHYPQPHRDIQIAIESMDLEFLRSDFEKLLKSMKTGSERIKKIVTSLRTFARLDESEFKSVDLHEGIESTLTILQNRLQKQEKRAEIKVEKDYGKLPLVECYAGQLNQVFLNILNNAIDALEECERQDDLTLRISTETDEKQVKIAIADNGVGMSEQTQKQLFDPFFTTKEVGKGTGLGLAIAQSIVTEKHGGKISCDSTVGQGTTFTLVIPGSNMV